MWWKLPKEIQVSKSNLSDPLADTRGLLPVSLKVKCLVRKREFDPVNELN